MLPVISTSQTDMSALCGHETKESPLLWAWPLLCCRNSASFTNYTLQYLISWIPAALAGKEENQKKAQENSAMQ